MDRLTDIFDFRVAFATENDRIIVENQGSQRPLPYRVKEE